MVRDCIIKITASGIYFNDLLRIRFNSTNLPIQNLNIDDQAEIFWLVQQIAYNKSANLLKVEVVDYFYSPLDQEFEHQSPKYPIENIYFQNLRELSVLKQAIGYYQRYKKLRAPANLPISNSEVKSDQSPNKMQQPIELRFKVYFKDAFFQNGFIVFEKYITEVDKHLLFEIENSHIISEYEYIKSYFSKILRKKQFNASARILAGDNPKKRIACKSPELEKIDQQLIESIKHLRTRELIKQNINQEPDKSLFTADDIFDTLNDSAEAYGNVFRQSEEDILHFLMNFKKVRNRKQLEYLAGKLQSNKMKLKFTMYPHFGFLFLLEGEEMNHFCWELLNSHATYLWSIDKSSKLHWQIKRVERIINSIRTTGRQQYRISQRQTLVDDDDFLFSVINHDSISSNFVDGFAVWKQKLQEKLI